MPPNTRLKAANEMPSQSQVTPTTSPSKRQADGPAVSDTSTKIRRIANIFSMDTSHPGRKLTAQFTKVYEDFGEVQDEQERIVRLLEQGSSRQDEMDVKTEQHEKQLKAHSSQFDKLDKIIKDELGTWPTSVAFKIEIEQWKIKQKEFCDKQKQSNGDWQNEQTQMRATEKKQLEEALKLQNDAIQQVRQEFGDAENEQQRRIEAVEKQLGNNQQLNEEDAIALEVRQHDLELNFRKDRAKVATLAQIVMQNGDDTEQLFNDTEAHYVTTMAAMEEFKRDSSAIQAFQATQIEALLSRVDSMEAARAGYDQEVARLSEAHKKELDQQIQANTELLNRVEAVEAEAKDSKIFRGISKPQIESAQQHIAALQTAHGNYATAEHLAIAKDEISKIVTDVLNSHATKEELDDLQTSLVTALQTHLHKLNQTCHDRTQGARNLIQNQKFVTVSLPSGMAFHPDR